jgi:hypothetical protein
MRESPGLVSPDGALLSGATRWVPVLSDDLVAFALEVRVPPGWDAVSQGRRVVHERDAEGTRVRERCIVHACVGLRTTRRAHELIEVLAVLGGGGRTEREGQPDRLIGDSAGEPVGPHRSEQSSRDRLRDQHRPIHHHEQLVARERDGVGAAQAAPNQHDELAQHHVHATRIDLRAQLDQPRWDRGEHHDRPRGRDRARELGQPGGSQVWCEVVGEHDERVRRMRREAAAATPTASNPRGRDTPMASRAVAAVLTSTALGRPMGRSAFLPRRPRPATHALPSTTARPLLVRPRRGVHAAEVRPTVPGDS